ncbi:hypothetical protein MHC_02920 [Mycoplasma haemocanis str. Illinois]|uniref:Uncharacterized protein n=1 Tax=Mycoplasma haemocanis (strain Illinois) TaxID=1111676 RepID=H6N724_MYCHN|nr:hypothetical protein [Mycoplasma haemocanis]AEW45446.1 hypothetical protein MHC_02920 [Mycoplasma haemocanis str. Illinois]
MNYALGVNTSHLAWGVGVLGFLSTVISFTYWTAPPIGVALEDEGYRLISESRDKEELYRRSFLRNKNVLIDMNLDGQMNDGIEDDEGSIALNIWCDLNLSKKLFFVSLTKYKQFCALSMSDVLWLEKKGQQTLNINKFHYILGKPEGRFKNTLFPRFRLTWDDKNLKRSYDIWKNWCEFELSKPYFFESGRIKNTIKVNCMMDEGELYARFSS